MPCHGTPSFNHSCKDFGRAQDGAGTPLRHALFISALMGKVVLGARTSSWPIYDSDSLRLRAGAGEIQSLVQRADGRRARSAHASCARQPGRGRHDGVRERKAQAERGGQDAGRA